MAKGNRLCERRAVLCTTREYEATRRAFVAQSQKQPQVGARGIIPNKPIQALAKQSGALGFRKKNHFSDNFLDVKNNISPAHA